MNSCSRMSRLCPGRCLSDRGSRDAVEGAASCGERQTLAQDLPVAGEEALERGRGQIGRARLARVLDGSIGLEQEIAHGCGPRLPVDLDQRLQFAQMMGVAQRMTDVGEPGVRLEAVMNRDSALSPSGISPRLADTR